MENKIDKTLDEYIDCCSLSNLGNQLEHFEMKRVPEMDDCKDFEHKLPSDEFQEDAHTDECYVYDQVLEEISNPIRKTSYASDFYILNILEQPGKLLLTAKIKETSCRNVYSPSSTVDDENQEDITVAAPPASSKLSTKTCSNNVRPNAYILSDSELRTLKDTERRTTTKDLTAHINLVRDNCTLSNSAVEMPNVDERANNAIRVTINEQYANIILNHELEEEYVPSKTELKKQNNETKRDAVTIETTSSSIEKEGDNNIEESMAIDEEQEDETLDELVVSSSRLPTITCSDNIQLNATNDRERRIIIQNLEFHSGLSQSNFMSSDSALKTSNVVEISVGDNEVFLTINEQNINIILNPELISNYEKHTDIMDNDESCADDSEDDNNVLLTSELESLSHLKETGALNDVMLTSEVQQDDLSVFELKSKSSKNERDAITIETIPSNVETDDNNSTSSSELIVLYEEKQRNAVNTNSLKNNFDQNELSMSYSEKQKDEAEKNKILVTSSNNETRIQNGDEQYFVVDNETLPSVSERSHKGPSGSETEASKVQEEGTAGNEILQYYFEQDNSSSNFDLRERITEEQESIAICHIEQDSTMTSDLELQDLNVEEQKQTTHNELDKGAIKLENEHYLIKVGNKSIERYIVASKSAELSNADLLLRGELEEYTKIEKNQVAIEDIHFKKDSFSHDLTESTLLNNVPSHYQSNLKHEDNEEYIIKDENETDRNESGVKYSHKLLAKENVVIIVVMEAEADILIRIEYKGEEDQLGNLEFNFEATDSTLEILNYRSVSPVQIENELLPQSSGLHITISKGVKKGGQIRKRLLDKNRADSSMSDETKDAILNSSSISGETSSKYCKKEKTAYTWANDKSEFNYSCVEDADVEVITRKVQMNKTTTTESGVENFIVQNDVQHAKQCKDSESNPSKFLPDSTEMSMTSDLQNDSSISNEKMISADDERSNETHTIEFKNEFLEEQDLVQIKSKSVDTNSKIDGVKYEDINDSNDLCTSTDVNIEAELTNNKTTPYKKYNNDSLRNEISIDTNLKTQELSDLQMTVSKDNTKSGTDIRVSDKSDDIILSGSTFSGELSRKFSNKEKTETIWINNKSKNGCSKDQNPEVEVVKTEDQITEIIMIKPGVENIIENDVRHNQTDSESNSSKFLPSSTEMTMTTDLQNESSIPNGKIISVNDEVLNGMETIQVKNETLDEQCSVEIKSESVDPYSKTNTVEYEETNGSDDLCTSMDVDIEAEQINKRTTSSCKEDDNDSVKHEISIETQIAAHPISDRCKTAKIALVSNIGQIQIHSLEMEADERCLFVSETSNELGTNLCSKESSDYSIAVDEQEKDSRVSTTSTEISDTCNNQPSCIHNTVDNSTEVIVPEITYTMEKSWSNESNNNSISIQNVVKAAHASKTSIETDETHNKRLSPIALVTATITNVTVPEVTHAAVDSENIDPEEIQFQRHIVWNQDSTHPDLMRQKMNSTKSTPQRSFGCRHCKKQFPSQPLLNSHTTMHGSLSNVLQCVVCLLTFSDKKKMYVHASLAHQDQTIIFCDMCGKTFLLRTHIKHHISNCHKGVSGPKLYTIIKSKCPFKNYHSSFKNGPTPVKDPEVMSMRNSQFDFMPWINNKHNAGKKRRTLIRQFVDDKIGNVIYLPGYESLEDDNTQDSQVEDPLALEYTEQTKHKENANVSALFEYARAPFDSSKTVESNWFAKTLEKNKHEDTICYKDVNAIIPCSTVNFNSPNFPFECSLSKTVGMPLPDICVMPNENINKRLRTPINDSNLSNERTFTESGKQDSNCLKNVSSQESCMAYETDGNASSIVHSRLRSNSQQNTPIIGDCCYWLVMNNSLHSNEHCQQEFSSSGVMQMPHPVQMTTAPRVCTLPLNSTDTDSLSKNNQRIDYAAGFFNTRSEIYALNPRNTANNLSEMSTENNTIAQVSSSSDDRESIDMKPDVIMIDDGDPDNMKENKETTEIADDSKSPNSRRDESDWKSITEMMTSILDQTTDLLNRVRVSSLPMNKLLEPEAGFAKKRKSDVIEVSSSAAKKPRHECPNVVVFNKTSTEMSERNANSWRAGTSQNLTTDRMETVTKSSANINGKKSYDLRDTKRVNYVSGSSSKDEERLGTNKATKSTTDLAAVANAATNDGNKMETNTTNNKTYANLDIETNEVFSKSKVRQCGETIRTDFATLQYTADSVAQIRRNLENLKSRITDEIEVEYIPPNKVAEAVMAEESSDIEIIHEFSTSKTNVAKSYSPVSLSYLCDYCGETVCQSQDSEQHLLHCTAKSKNLELSDYLCDSCGKMVSRSHDDEHLPGCAARSRNSASSDYPCHCCGDKVCRMSDTGHSLRCIENSRSCECSEYLCDHCGEKIRRLQDIERHSLRCTARNYSLESSEYLCDYCGETVRQSQDIDQHLLRCSAKSVIEMEPRQESDRGESDIYNPETQSYIADDSENTDSNDMESDMDLDWYRSLNYIPQKMQRYKKDVICEIVSQDDVVAEFPEQFERFLQRYLSMHRRTKKPFCFLCRSRADNVSELYTHFVLTHKHFYFSCNECELIFLESSSLMRHLFSHKYTYRRFPCHFCLKMHRSIFARDYHETKHQNRTLFSCLFCHMDYFGEELFNAHMDAHEVASYHYVCSLCSLTYLTQLDLVMHKSLNGCYPGIRQQVVAQVSPMPISNLRSSLRSSYRNKIVPKNH